MSGYSIKDYGIFQDAVTTTNNFSTAATTGSEVINSCKTALSNDSVFMGPACDSCIEALNNSYSKLENIIANCASVVSYFGETVATYKTGDNKAAKILSFSNGSFTTSTSHNSGVQTGKTNQDTIYNYLSKKGFNDAAISGILANIQHESGFNPTAVGDGGTSYGICQWHLGRRERMKDYCRQNNLDVDSVEGQVDYLVWELQNHYPSVYEKIKSVPNTAQGAYDAAYEWTVHFEIPQNKEAAGHNRGNTAQSSYWPTYSSSTTEV